MSEIEPCVFSTNEVCQVYCADGRRLCDEVSAFDVLFSGIEQLTRARDVAIVEANTDTLTGLTNKAGLFNLGEQMVQDAEMGSDTFGVLMLDISNFKLFNDTKGHVAGDELLKKVGTHLRVLTRDDDYVVSRFGGDEFVLLCKLGARTPENTQTPQERILSITQRLYHEIGLVLASEAEYLLPAFGASIWAPGETFEDVLVKADKLMYKNKRRQKDRPEFDEN